MNIEHIIKLANIQMNDKERVLLENQLDNIINWLDVIAKVDTSGIEPMHNVLQDLHFINTQNYASSGAVGADKVLSNSPEIFDNFFVIPKVIDN